VYRKDEGAWSATPYRPPEFLIWIRLWREVCVFQWLVFGRLASSGSRKVVVTLGTGRGEGDWGFLCCSEQRGGRRVRFGGGCHRSTFSLALVSRIWPLPSRHSPLIFLMLSLWTTYLGECCRNIWLLMLLVFFFIRLEVRVDNVWWPIWLRGVATHRFSVLILESEESCLSSFGYYSLSLSKLQWPRCHWDFQCRGTGHSVKFNWFPVNFHWFPVEFHWISSGIPPNFPVATGSLVTSDLSLVLAKSAGLLSAPKNVDIDYRNVSIDLVYHLNAYLICFPLSRKAGSNHDLFSRWPIYDILYDTLGAFSSLGSETLAGLVSIRLLHYVCRTR